MTNNGYVSWKSQYLSPDAAIIHYPVFESALYALQDKPALSIEEEKMIPFKENNNNLNNTQDNTINSEPFVEWILNE